MRRGEKKKTRGAEGANRTSPDWAENTPVATRKIEAAAAVVVRGEDGNEWDVEEGTWDALWGRVDLAAAHRDGEKTRRQHEKDLYTAYPMEGQHQEGKRRVDGTAGGDRKLEPTAAAAAADGGVGTAAAGAEGKGPMAWAAGGDAAAASYAQVGTEARREEQTTWQEDTRSVPVAGSAAVAGDDSGCVGRGSRRRRRFPSKSAALQIGAPSASGYPS